MIKFNYTKEELKTLADNVYLSDRQRRIIEYRMLDYSIDKMAELETCGTATISRELDKIVYKISRIMIKKWYELDNF